MGGDSGYYYIGDYKLDNGRIAARVEVTNFIPEIASIFGPGKQFTLELEGEVPDDLSAGSRSPGTGRTFPSSKSP